jgi:hypothetical protein
MPTKKDVLYRLLNLYPVSVLKEHWGIKKASKDEIINTIVNKAGETEIFTFSRVNQDLTKQHLFIFENEPEELKSIPAPLLADQPLKWSVGSKETREEFYLIEVVFKVVIGPAPYRDKELRFLWPISFLVSKTYTLVTFTILEKKIDAYLQAGEEALSVTRNIDEQTILNLLTESIPDTLTLNRADLNKGIKMLWRTGKIDAMSSRWKPPRATVTQTMDRQFLLKRDDPDAFDEAIKAPLLKNLFVLLGEKDEEAEEEEGQDKALPHFAATPSDGEIMFNRYPKAEEVKNVVRAILAAN